MSYDFGNKHQSIVERYGGCWRRKLIKADKPLIVSETHSAPAISLTVCLLV